MIFSRVFIEKINESIHAEDVSRIIIFHLTILIDLIYSEDVGGVILFSRADSFRLISIMKR